MSLLKNLLIFSAFATLAGCGVKGDPLPPLRPAELGRGRPTYKRATESLKIEKVRNVEKARHADDDDDDDEGE